MTREHSEGPTRRPARRRTVIRVVLAAILVGPGALLGSACGADAPDAEVVAPVPDTATPDAAEPDTRRPTTTVGTPPSVPVADPTAPTPTDASSDGTAWQVVEDVLARYGSVLDQLSADPTGAPAADSEARARWDQVVVAGSALSDEVLGRLHRRAVEERVIVVAGPQGVAYRHQPSAIVSVGGSRIDFEWCGWSPGIGRSIDTGEVVDEQVAHAVGSGHLEHDGERWRLGALDQVDLVLLEPGAADPCVSPDPGGER